MAQLGAGLVGIEQEGYPTIIDTYQTFVNGSTALPDSNTRIDSEVIMDILKTLISIESTLGARVNGVYGSLAARLNQFLPGGGGLPGIITFANALTVSVPGTTHNVGQAALLWQLYDANIPANAMGPGAVQVEVDTTSYDVTLTFVTPTSGMLALGATSPIYQTTFSNTQSVTVPGTVHQLGTSDLQYAVYDNSTPRRRAMVAGSFSVHQTTHDVHMGFATTTSGLLVLSAGGPVYATNFNLTTPPYTFDILGSTHHLGTQALLFKTYDAANPRNQIGDPAIAINPSTYDIHIAFAVPVSGRIVFAPATTLSGHDFDLRDSGVIDQSATRVRSLNNALLLQSGPRGRIYFLNATGQAVAVLGTQDLPGHLGLGIDTTHQLELTSGDAVKAGGGAWLTPSSAALKEAIEPFQEGLETLLQLEPVSYRYKPVPERRPNLQRYVGLLGEAVEAISAVLVQRHVPAGTAPEHGQLLLDPSPLVYMLINAVKTLHGGLLEAREGQHRLEQRLSLLSEQLLALDERVLALEPLDEGQP